MPGPEPLRNLDVATLAHAEAADEASPAVTEEEAKSALQSAGLHPEVSVARVKARGQVGKFLAPKVSGLIQAQAAHFSEIAEEVSEILLQKLRAAEAVEDIVDLASVWASTSNAAANWAAMRAKASEVSGKRITEQRQQHLAPHIPIQTQEVNIYESGTPGS